MFLYFSYLPRYFLQFQCIYLSIDPIDDDDDDGLPFFSPALPLSNTRNTCTYTVRRKITPVHNQPARIESLCILQSQHAPGRIRSCLKKSCIIQHAALNGEVGRMHACMHTQCMSCVYAFNVHFWLVEYIRRELPNIGEDITRVSKVRRRRP